MEFGKYEAIYWLFHEVGSSDGKFSDLEIDTVNRKSSFFRSIFSNLNKELLLAALASGSLNDESACKQINLLDMNEKVELIAALLLITNADTVWSDDETNLIAKYCYLIQVDFEEAKKRFTTYLGNN
jgi:uncharacterized tellurite resistance protein B-like protein